MPERVNAGHAIAALGALALFVSLFLDWYEGGVRGDGVSAWTVFELVDLLLAVIAVATLVAVSGDLLERARSVGAERWLPALGGAALLLVLVSIVNNPPAVIESSEKAGAWIALTGAILIVLGALFGERRISIVVSSSGRKRPEPQAQPREPTGPALDPEGGETKTQPINPGRK